MFTVTTLSFKNLFQFVPFKELLYLVPISSYSFHSLFLSTLAFFPSPLGRLTSAALQVLISLSRMLFSSVQSLSCVLLFATPWTAACQASLSITNSQSLPKLMSIESVMPSNHLILSSPSPPALNLSQHQGLYQSVSSSHQVANIYTGLYIKWVSKDLLYSTWNYIQYLVITHNGKESEYIYIYKIS